MAEPMIQLDEAEVLADQPELDQVETETTSSESSTEETNAEAQTSDEEPSEGEDTEGEKEADDDESGEDESDDADDKTDETDTDEPKKKSVAGRKAQLTREIRDLVAQRDDALRQAQQANSVQYRAATPQELVDQGLDEATARVTALEQNLQLERFNNQIAQTRMSIETEARQVMHDFPAFDAQSQGHREDLHTLANTVYNSVKGEQVDPKTGLTYQVDVLPYQVYEAVHKAFEMGQSTAKVTAQRSAEKMMASVETPTSVAPVQPKEDPFLAGLRKGLPQNN